MFVRLLIGLLLTCAISGCASTTPAPTCTFVIASDVAGVTVHPAIGSARTSTAGQNLQFELPCSPQNFRFDKPCYKSRQITLNPNAARPQYRLDKASWEQFGYLRVENASKSNPLVIANLPGEALHVGAWSHAARRIPLGDHSIQISAPYKVPTRHEFRLCSEDDIFNLRVATNEADGKLVAQGAQDVLLEHGVGSLRVVTEVSDAEFKLTTDRSGQVQEYLNTLGVKDVNEIDLEQAPEGLRQALGLLQSLRSESFKAPAALTLPAGRYWLTYTHQEDEAKPLSVEIQPGRETRIEL